MPMGMFLSEGNLAAVYGNWLILNLAKEYKWVYKRNNILIFAIKSWHFKSTGDSVLWLTVKVTAFTAFQVTSKSSTASA